MLAVYIFWQQHFDYTISSRTSLQQSTTGARAPRRETIFNGLCVPGGSSATAMARPLGSGRVTRNRSFYSHTVATECYPYLTVLVRENIFYPSVLNWQPFAGPNLLQTTLAAVFLYNSIFLYTYISLHRRITHRHPWNYVLPYCRVRVYDA